MPRAGSLKARLQDIGYKFQSLSFMQKIPNSSSLSIYIEHTDRQRELLLHRLKHTYTRIDESFALGMNQIEHLKT